MLGYLQLGGIYVFTAAWPKHKGCLLLLECSPLAALRFKHKYHSVRATMKPHKCAYPVGAAFCLVLL